MSEHTRFIVCERVRKAVAHERQPQRAKRAMDRGAIGGAFSSASDDEVGGFQARPGSCAAVLDERTSRHAFLSASKRGRQRLQARSSRAERAIKHCARAAVLDERTSRHAFLSASKRGRQRLQARSSRAERAIKHCASSSKSTPGCVVIALTDEPGRSLSQRLGDSPAPLGRECAHR
jgi:hypothetical protein